MAAEEETRTKWTKRERENKVEEDEAGHDEREVTKMKMEQKHGLSAQVQPGGV
jgi:hypothetical protein